MTDESHEQLISEAYKAFQHARDSGYYNLAAKKWCEIQRLVHQRHVPSASTMLKEGQQ